MITLTLICSIGMFILYVFLKLFWGTSPEDHKIEPDKPRKEEEIRTLPQEERRGWVPGSRIRKWFGRGN